MLVDYASYSRHYKPAVLTMENLPLRMF